VHPQPDDAAQEVAEHGVDAAQLVELVEDRPDHGARLLVRVEGQRAGWRLDVPARHLEEQLAARRLVELAAVEAIP
jgi:hypothetical protein